jgi:hypothetical protein
MNRPSHVCTHGCVISVNDVERAIHRVFWSSEICAKTEKDEQWQWWMITPDYLLMMFYSRHTQMDCRASWATVLAVSRKCHLLLDPHACSSMSELSFPPNEFISLEKQHAYLLARNVWIDAMGTVWVMMSQQRFFNKLPTNIHHRSAFFR